MAGIGEAAIGNILIDDELLIGAPVKTPNPDQIRVGQLRNGPNMALKILELLGAAAIADSPDGQNGAVFQDRLIHDGGATRTQYIRRRF